MWTGEPADPRAMQGTARQGLSEDTLTQWGKCQEPSQQRSSLFPPRAVKAKILRKRPPERHDNQRF